MQVEKTGYWELSHNVSNLVYHIVCPAKYRRVVFDKNVDEHLRQIFVECPEVKKKLWGGQFWTDGYFVENVGKNQSESVVKAYGKNLGGKQDTEYRQLYLGVDCIAD